MSLLLLIASFSLLTRPRFHLAEVFLHLLELVEAVGAIVLEMGDHITEMLQKIFFCCCEEIQKMCSEKNITSASFWSSGTAAGTVCVCDTLSGLAFFCAFPAFFLFPCDSLRSPDMQELGNKRDLWKQNSQRRTEKEKVVM